MHPLAAGLIWLCVYVCICIRVAAWMCVLRVQSHASIHIIKHAVQLRCHIIMSNVVRLYAYLQLSIKSVPLYRCYSKQHIRSEAGHYAWRQYATTHAARLYIIIYEGLRTIVHGLTHKH